MQPYETSLFCDMYRHCCVRRCTVQTRPVFPPCQHVGRLEVQADEGPHYLASAVAEDRGFGSSRCPWTLVAPRGRRLNVTLLDFAIVSRHPDLNDADVCHVYARIRPLPSATDNKVPARRESGEVTVCAGRVRERSVFVSDTERVEVTMLTSSKTNSDDPVYFLLRYSGSYKSCLLPANPLSPTVAI